MTRALLAAWMLGEALLDILRVARAECRRRGVKR